MSNSYRETGTDRWVLTVQENGETRELYIQFPPDAISQVGWAEGDVIEWLDNGNGSWTLQKKQ